MKPNLSERTRLIEAARATVVALEALPILTPCQECGEFQHGFCLRWQDTVPDDTRDSGCSEWCEQIPF